MSEIICKVVINKKELDDAYRIREDVFIKEQHVPKEIELDHYDEKAIHFIAYEEGRPIAAARIRPYDHNNTVKIERVAVLRAYRGSGIGKLLMNFVEKEAEKLGYTIFRLYSQRHAEIFYTKLGYLTISEPFYEADIEHVIMEKKIEAV